MSTTSPDELLEDGIAFLAGNGLNLFAVLECESLPEDISEPLSETLDLGLYARLVIVGNTGKQFWRALQQAADAHTDRMDTFSSDITTVFCQRYLNGNRYELVFPSAHSIPLQRIGALLGWGQPSPLGIAISEQHGLWFAYRSAFLTTAELPITEKIIQSHPCDRCVDKPCLSACPGLAVSSTEAFDVGACFTHRLADKSPCISTCLARLACPVAQDSRYPTEMIQYIYQTSMKTVRRYAKS